MEGRIYQLTDIKQYLKIGLVGYYSLRALRFMPTSITNLRSTYLPSYSPNAYTIIFQDYHHYIKRRLITFSH